ncbi:MAG: ABC transporter substrate-binding protein [Chloroflexi bacterium]|nr:ABC transporter substrate-binding protein [Chloroflexota bacterium]
MNDALDTFDPDAQRFYPPYSVVSLVPSVTESLFDLGLGAHVLGVTDYCTRPAEKVRYLPHVGGTKNPDIAKIVELAPNLVIANHEENRRRDVEALQAAGIPVWVTYPRTVSDTFNLLWQIMSVFEAPDQSARVRHIEQMYDWVWGATLAKQDLGALPTVFAPIWFDPLMTFSPDTYMHDLLYVCGARGIFSDQADRYPRVTLEQVEAAKPDIVLLPSEPYEFTESHAEQFAQLDIPAAHHSRIHFVDGALLTWHGTRIAYALQELPALLELTHDDIA